MDEVPAELLSVKHRVEAIGRPYQYADELFSDLCRVCLERPNGFPWAADWCQAVLVRKAHELMIDELRRRSVRAEAERAYQTTVKECQVVEPYDKGAELRQVLDRAIDSLPKTYRSAVRESLETANSIDRSVQAGATHRTKLYRARLMLAEDSCLLAFVAED